MTSKNKFLCRSCGRLSGETPGMIPALVRGGPIVLVDIPACPGCQELFDIHMEKNFWRGALGLSHGKCAKCRKELTSQNGRHAYRRAINGGAREITLLCDFCHAEYAKCCGLTTEKK